MTEQVRAAVFRTVEDDTLDALEGGVELDGVAGVENRFGSAEVLARRMHQAHQAVGFPHPLGPRADIGRVAPGPDAEGAQVIARPAALVAGHEQAGLLRVTFRDQAGIARFVEVLPVIGEENGVKAMCGGQGRQLRGAASSSIG